jgi:uncharacterized protein YcbX
VITVSRLSLTAVKGTRLREVDALTLGADGAEDNRRFYLIDERDRMVNGKQVGELLSVVAEFDPPRLALTFPDGRVVVGALSLGAPVQTRFFSLAREARVVEGPWARALSEFVGQPLRLVDGGTAVDRSADGGVTLISRGSLERLASEAGVPSVDARRFRMLVEVEGVDAHAEDTWVGKRAQIGDALVQVAGHVGRCLVTSRDPDRGRIDLPTLDVLRRYRGEVPATEPLPFGIFGAVVEPGTVRVGDPVSLSSP